MKKILTTAMVLGSLLSAAKAESIITSPLYMPKAGDTLSDTKLGFFKEDYSYDRAGGTTNDYSHEIEHWAVKHDMNFGVRDDWSIDFGFTYMFDRERERDFNADASDTNFRDDATFKNTYIGLTKRFISDNFKLDGLAKIYMQGEKFFVDGASTTEITRNESLDLAVRAGFEIADGLYDTAVSVGLLMTPEERSKSAANTTSTRIEIDPTLDWYVEWENQLNPIAGFNFGLDIKFERKDYYTRTQKANGVIQTGATQSYSIGKQDIWSVDGDVNYLINDTVAIGAYVEFKDYSNTNTHAVSEAGDRTSIYSSDNNKDSLEYGVQTIVQF